MSWEGVIITAVISTLLNVFPPVFIPYRKRDGHYFLIGVSETISTYQRQVYRTKEYKDRIENAHSSPMAYGLNEPWTWYDKCTKRHRNHGKIINCRPTIAIFMLTSGSCNKGI